MKEEIVVSVICIAYNHENFIERALKSFVSQKTTFKYEILVHEDASVDKTAEIIRNYEKKYPNLLKVIYQKENQYSKGKSPSKILWEIAKGKYLALCEGDDYWIDECKLQKQVDFLEENKNYIGCCHNNYVVDKYEKKIFYKGYYPLLEEHDILTREELKYNFGLCGHTSTMLFKNFWKELSKEKKEEWLNLRGPGDQILNSYLISKGKVRFLKDIMSCYRVTFDTSSWTSQRMGKNTCYSDCLEKLEREKFLDKEYNEYRKFNFSPHIIGALKKFFKKPSRKNFEIIIKILTLAKQNEKNILKIISKFLMYIFTKILEKLKIKKGIECKWKKLEEI